MTRIAIIKKDKCFPTKCNELCKGLCPVNRAGKECILIGKTAKIEESLCVGCGICPLRCPYQAISIVNLPEKLEEQMHRFGENSFELYSLPLVKQNTVVGVIGRNGIGKTTALNILAGVVKPNLGNYKNPPDEKEIIAKFSKKWIGTYFTKLFANKMKISYKPQRVELLKEMFNDTVKDLLKRVDEREQFDVLVEELELTNILSRSIKDLSGGELQRVAIAACMLKRAEVYYFDEPASFLDISHRIKIAKLIRKLAEENVSIIVIEHDLATLDYISDEIQIVYGKPACYGIFSQSKAVRRGINEYLDGFLPDENIRFRDYSIKYAHTVRESATIKQLAFEIPTLIKKFKDFSLEVKPGRLHKQEILTIVGANGLGKSTFLKLLAKELKSETGEVPEIKISYKPQSLEAEDKKVVDYLQDIAGNEYDSGWYKQNILEKLNINDILNNNMSELSGGELQKVLVAGCLSKEADLFLIDEPSAFIDVEDRLAIAEVIRDFIQKNETTAIIVDHDIQFIDYISDSILVFEGIPGKEGNVYWSKNKEEGMNRVLKFLDITYRQDKETHRPRINKPGSQLDSEQRKSGKYYYK
ncbi:MAG: ribosome biogenesis/translation initiation ATPase RLI [Candidatus Nanoarchaeia archaeon]